MAHTQYDRTGLTDGKALQATPPPCPEVVVKPDPAKVREEVIRHTLCTFIGPEPDCKVYKKFSVEFNCPPLNEVIWTEDDVEIPLSGVPAMADLTLPEANNSKTALEAETNLIVLPADTAATAADLVALAIAAAPALSNMDGSKTTPALASDAVSYRIVALPCDSAYLTDPTDVSTTATVGTADGVFVGGVPVGSRTDDAFAGVDLTAPIARGADAVMAVCVQFARDFTKAELAAL